MKQVKKIMILNIFNGVPELIDVTKIYENHIKHFNFKYAEFGIMFDIEKDIEMIILSFEKKSKILTIMELPSGVYDIGKIKNKKVMPYNENDLLFHSPYR